MDVVDDASLLFERVVDGASGNRGLLESLTKFVSGFLKTLPPTMEIAVGLTGDEAEGGG